MEMVRAAPGGWLTFQTGLAAGAAAAAGSAVWAMAAFAKSPANKKPNRRLWMKDAVIWEFSWNGAADSAYKTPAIGVILRA